MFQFKPNRLPFPAVTFCNLNPYKKSALTTMPEVAQLMKTYNQYAMKNRNDTLSENNDQLRRNRKREVSQEDLNSANESTPTKMNKVDSQVKIRRKRQGSGPSTPVTAAPCGSCDYSNPIWLNKSNISSPTTFVRYSQVHVTWPCSFTCCSQSPDGSSRPAQITNSNLFSLLTSTGVIGNQTVPVAWIGMASDPQSPDTYMWYNAPTNPTINVDWAPICQNNSCTKPKVDNVTGAMVAYYANGQVVFHKKNGTGCAQPVICECKCRYFTKFVLNLFFLESYHEFSAHNNK